jgi:hypothetical protein
MEALELCFDRVWVERCIRRCDPDVLPGFVDRNR